MKKRANDVLLGAVIIGAIALIIGVSLFLRQTDIGTRRHTVTARFRDVGQVQVGNAVVIRGVNAGKVEAVELVAGGWVHVRISLNKDIALPQNPVLLLGASSLFGEWQGSLTTRRSVPPGAEVAAQLEEAAGGGPGVLPGAVLPDVAQLTTVAGSIAGDVAAVSRRIQVAFNDSAAREIRASIHSVSTLSSELSKTVRVQSRNLDTVSVSVLQGAASLSRASTSLARSVARIDSATSRGEVQAIMKDVSRTASQARDASERLNRLTLGLERTEVSLRSVMLRADSVLMKVDKGQGTLGLMVNDGGLYRNTDSVMVDIRSLIADIKKNPRRYIKLTIF
jgi:phospholipid/cholesterol/gamma-HCH transport system substrate-binding protein